MILFFFYYYCYYFLKINPPFDCRITICSNILLFLRDKSSKGKSFWVKLRGEKAELDEILDSEKQRQSLPRRVATLLADDITSLIDTTLHYVKRPTLERIQLHDKVPRRISLSSTAKPRN